MKPVYWVVGLTAFGLVCAYLAGTDLPMQVMHVFVQHTKVAIALATACLIGGVSATYVVVSILK